MSDTLPPLGIQRVKVIGLAVQDLERANHFYGTLLGLAPALKAPHRSVGGSDRSS
jgi:catechol 2,3-dioxygenase-like lactoylglutathione lyase family enzyme